MMAEPVDKYFGTPLSEWIERVPHELEVDAVGFWQIIPTGRDSFGLDGDMLKDFTRRCLVALLKRGAVPVRASPEKDIFWVRQDSYGNDMDTIIRNVMDEWEKSGVDPDHNGLWFALLED